MPGILPMKVIKVGVNAQTRIAQACDRCRSKKIRCDGIRPSCTQCVNVGFECKTSDKLSRRAFPRGYTESLEERVRCLEAEVRELKALLDEKDEKIDMLSRIHSHSPKLMTHSPVAVSPDSSEQAPPEPDDLFKVVQSPMLLDDENSDSYFMGTSSGRTLIDAFKHKLQQTGQAAININTDTFFSTESKASTDGIVRPHVVCWKAPARLVSDQLVNIFFQEWAPLFPVLHRPTFLSLYEEYVSCPEAMEDKKSLAQLHLVFGIAAQSSDIHNNQDLESFEAQWQAALEFFIMDSSMVTLQCLVLAQIYCLQKADYARLLKYKGLAISLSHRLGLHQSQKRFALGALTSETRKKVFWTLYALDCFSAAQLGLPQLMKEEDVHCEYPVDADDEYVTEKGFLPTLPGEFTKLSSALALFRGARVLAKVLKENYPAATSHEISFRKISALSDELDEWCNNLAPHLRLQFIQDKPSTNVISSRSPLLSLAYQYIRSLIYRPAVCASSAIGDKASAAFVALASCSKHVVQIVELLEERRLSFSFCLNKNELLVLSGFGLLFQGLDLDRNGALAKDNNRLIATIADILDRIPSPTSIEFRSISCSLTYNGSPMMRNSLILSRHNSDSNITTVDEKIQNTQKQMKAIASRFTSAITKARSEPNNDRRATVPTVNSPMGAHHNPSQVSITSIRSEPAVPRSEPAMSPHIQRSSLSPVNKHLKPRAGATLSHTNLDYLSFSNDSIISAYPHAINNAKAGVSTSDWERLLSSLDNGQTNIYDTIYGGQPADALVDIPPLSAAAAATTAPSVAWSPPDVWAIGNEMSHLTTAPPTQSVLSFSDESLTSGEEFADLGGPHPPTVTAEETYRGIVIPELSPYSENMALAGLDGNFGL